MRSELRYPLRVNIGIAVVGAAYDAVIEFNSALVSIGHTTIAFRPAGEANPHVTLLMGRVLGPGNLRHILGAVRAFSEELQPEVFELGRPHYANGSAGFIFSSVSPGHNVVAERASLFSGLQGSLQLDHYGGVGNPPHVTLGYVESGEMLAGVAPWPAGRISFRRDRIDVSLVGPKGTATQTLESFQLP